VTEGPIISMKRYKSKQIVNLLGRVKVAISNPKTTHEEFRDAGTIVQTYYRSRNEFPGLNLDEAKQPKEP